jgi:hypothetical protein
MADTALMLAWIVLYHDLNVVWILLNYSITVHHFLTDKDLQQACEDYRIDQ